MELSNNKSLKLIIIIICVIVPLLVGCLYLLPEDIKEMGIDTSFLPPLNAIINSLTAGLLVFAVIAVKNKQIEMHKKLMFSALGLGAIFLLSYVAYHATTMSVKYGDIDHNGILSDFEYSLISSSATFYYILLISHIFLSIVVLPFVLFAVYFALTDNSPRHKNIVRFAFPVWLYVSVTGVIVYFMISPYYV